MTTSSVLNSVSETDGEKGGQTARQRWAAGPRAVACLGGRGPRPAVFRSRAPAAARAPPAPALRPGTAPRRPRCVQTQESPALQNDSGVPFSLRGRLSGRQGDRAGGRASLPRTPIPNGVPPMCTWGWLLGLQGVGCLQRCSVVRELSGTFRSV